VGYQGLESVALDDGIEVWQLDGFGEWYSDLVWMMLGMDAGVGVDEIKKFADED